MTGAAGKLQIAAQNRPAPFPGRNWAQADSPAAGI